MRHPVRTIALEKTLLQKNYLAIKFQASAHFGLSSNPNKTLGTLAPPCKTPNSKPQKYPR